ncbi:reverse transcriptase domain-containing protein [Tanacetum coccineum]
MTGISQPVMVKKSDGSWRMCVDFTDLNKACPQDCYPLPEIDWKVESLCGYPFKCFLDAYKGYHQIQMAKDDEEKTAFHTSQGSIAIQRCLLHGRMRVPIQVSRQVTPLVQNTQEVYEEGRLPLDYSSRRSFHAAQAAYSSTSHASRTPTRGGVDLMYYPMTHGAISAVLLTERDSGQTPEYFHQPIKQVISKPDASGRLQKWSVLLGEHNISYRPRTAVKGQILADFLIEKPETDAVLPQSEELEFTYARVRFELQPRTTMRSTQPIIADYPIAARIEDNMIQLPRQDQVANEGFDRFTIRQVPRGDNKKADALSKIASTSFAHLSKQVLVEILKNKSISEMEISAVIEEQDPTWMTPIIEFISKGTLPHEQKDARRICRTTHENRDFEMVSSIDVPGSSSMHSGPRSVVAKALRSGYYWPTMHRDARDMIKKCNDCQVHRPIPRQPQQELTPITSPWPFHKWVSTSLVPSLLQRED